MLAFGMVLIGWSGLFVVIFFFYLTAVTKLIGIICTEVSVTPNVEPGTLGRFLTVQVFCHHLLQVLLLADVHHDQALFDQAEAHVVLGVPKLYCDMWAGGTGVLHVQQALAVLDVPHHAVHHVCTGVLVLWDLDEAEGILCGLCWQGPGAEGRGYGS